MAIAAFWGTTVGYSECGYGTVSIEKPDGRVMVIKEETFEILFCRLSEFVAALKEDCIEYVYEEPGKPLLDYPDWYVDACADGWIYDDKYGGAVLVTEDGEVAVSPNSVILRNRFGDLRHMERYQFFKHYDTLME